jgi:hypothetical protein
VTLLDRVAKLHRRRLRGYLNHLVCGGVQVERNLSGSVVPCRAYSLAGTDRRKSMSSGL